MKMCSICQARVARLSVREGPVHFLGCNRQVPDTYADGILHGVGNGGCHGPNGVLPNAPGVVGARGRSQMLKDRFQFRNILHIGIL